MGDCPWPNFYVKLRPLEQGPTPVHTVQDHYGFENKIERHSNPFQIHSP